MPDDETCQFVHVIYEPSAYGAGLVFDARGNLLGALSPSAVNALPRLDDSPRPSGGGVRRHVIDPGRQRVFAELWERRAINHFSRYFARAFREGSPLIDSHRAFGPHVAPHLPSLSTTTVLDVGSGGAAYSALLAQRVISFDLPSAEGSASGTGPESRVSGTAEELPFASGVFSLVLCLFVLEHVADPYAVLREMCRVLGVGGRLVLAFPSASPGDIVRAMLRRRLTLPIHHLRTFGIVGTGVVESVRRVLHCLNEHGCAVRTVEGIYPDGRVRSRFPANRLGGQTIIVAEKEGT